MRQDDGVAGDGFHTVWASEDEGATMVGKSGANCNIMDTGAGDSIPYNCGGVRGILQIWTDLERGEVEGVPVRHSLGQHQGELSWPQIQGMVGTGGEEVAAGSHHAQHENGGADEIDIAGLSGLLADEQDAGWLKGRVIDGAAPADGEALVWDAVASEWTPGEARGIGLHVHVYKENLSAQCNGVKVTFLTANQFEPITLRVFHQRAEEVDGVAEDYVELGTYDGFTLAAAPAGGDKLVVHYLAELI